MDSTKQSPEGKVFEAGLVQGVSQSLVHMLRQGAILLNRKNAQGAVCRSVNFGERTWVFDFHWPLWPCGKPYHGDFEREETIPKPRSSMCIIFSDVKYSGTGISGCCSSKESSVPPEWFTEDADWTDEAHYCARLSVDTNHHNGRDALGPSGKCLILKLE